MNWRSRELYAESMKKLEHRVVTRLSAGSERLVKTLAPKTSIFGELRHATGASYITHCG
jgi:hypothetical protein